MSRKKGFKLTEEHKAKLRKPKHTKDSIQKIKDSISFEKSINWKGDRVGYSALHKWVSKVLGKPDTCEFCKTSGLTGKKIGWANKDHKYKRNTEDWIRLCRFCHVKYDEGRHTKYKKREKKRNTIHKNK